MVNNSPTPDRTYLSRRRFLLGGTAAVAAGTILVRPRRADALTINPRSSWAIDRPPKGPLPGEDVRFLLVHHSASRNGHTTAEAPGILRAFYDFHTGPEKGWNDIAYNFLIDAEGGIWEGREGSIAGSVAGDATGGNQGFSQLVCVIGDYNLISPPEAALSSLTQLLAWLADKHGVATSPGSTVTFTSQGSNKWPAGTSVTTPTINGHRAMSATTCPGDNLYEIVAGSLTADVDATRNGAPPPTNPTTVPPDPTTSFVDATTVPEETATSAVPTTAPADPVPTASTPSTPAGAVVASVVSSSSTFPEVEILPATAEAAAEEPQGRNPLVWGAAGLAAAATAGLAWRYKRMVK